MAPTTNPHTAVAYRPIRNGGGGRARRMQAFVWLLLLPPAVLLCMLVPPVAERARTSVRGASRSAPPSHAALVAFQQEKMEFKPLRYEPLATVPFMMAGAPAAPAPAAGAETKASSPSSGEAKASKSKSSKSPAKQPPVVMDVVYCINLPEDTSFFRIDYGEIEALFRQTVRRLLVPSASASASASASNATATATDTDTDTDTDTETTVVRFHLLSNDDEAIKRMTAVHPGLRVHDYRLSPPSDRSQAFLARYVHQSANPMEMERLCMWRWLLLADYFTQLQRESDSAPRLILGIDTDVGLYISPSRLLSAWKLQHWEDRGFEAHQIALGAAMLWSPKGLESFADFIGAVYATPEEARRAVKEWGDKFPFCRPARSLLLPCDANATKPEMWHMSDMDLLRAWLLQNSTVRTRKEEERCLVVRQARKASGTRLFLRRDAAAAHDDEQHKKNGTMPVLPTLMGIRPSNGNGNGNGTQQHEPEPVGLLHFQGPQSKKLILPFDAFLEGGPGNVKKEGEGKEEEEFVLP